VSADPLSVTLADVAATTGGALRGEAATPIRDVTHDSATVEDGTLFACRPGQRADGHDFAPAAAAAGAAALLVERWLDVGLPQVAVPSVAAVLGPAAALVHGAPSTRLRLLGVTGTNGKTTTAYLLEAILAAAGHRTGLVGTIETRIAGHSVAGVRTTPEASDLQRLLRRMLDEGVSAAAMEVSSHGLALGRVAGTRFAAVGFTNLSQDHLDFHGDMESYFAAKAGLFDPAYAAVGVVAVDDAWGRRLAAEAGIDVVTLSARGAAADVTASGVHAGPQGARFTAHLRDGDVAVRTRLAGDFNVDNALLALALAEAAGIDPAVAAEGLAALPGVPGRLEPVEAGQPFAVLVDYAHTPDAVASVLASLQRAAGGGRVLIVLGCGGDRDEDKRPHMGHAAVAGADHAVLTSDNPRSEDPEAILAAMRVGARQAGGSFEEVSDRAAAIAHAVALAAPGDVVLIAGKGHETVQEVAGVTHPFDDREVAAAALAEVRA